MFSWQDYSSVIIQHGDFVQKYLYIIPFKTAKNTVWVSVLSLGLQSGTWPEQIWTNTIWTGRSKIMTPPGLDEQIE